MLKSKVFHNFRHVQTDHFRVVASGQLTQSFREWLGEANDQMLSVKSDVCGTFLDPFQGCLHGRLDVLQTLLVAPPSWIQDGGAGNDVNQDLGYFFRSLLWWWWKMATLPLPVAILDDLISGSANEVIQDGGRKRKGRHFPPPPQWGSKKVPYTTNDSMPMSHEIVDELKTRPNDKI